MKRRKFRTLPLKSACFSSQDVLKMSCAKLETKLADLAIEPRGEPTLHSILDQRSGEKSWNTIHFLAALGSCEELAAVLSKPQCPIFSKDVDGRTPLMVALAYRRLKAAQLLALAEEREDFL